MFVRVFKASRRSARLRRRPEWQDTTPRTAGGRNAYKLADEYVPKFSRAFLDAMKGLLDEKVPKDFREAWESKSMLRMIDSIPLFAEGSTDQLKIWERFDAKVKAAYSGLMDEATKEAKRELDKTFKLKAEMKVEKAETPEEFSTPPIVNPYVAPWIENRLRALAIETLTESQIETITEILSNAFNRGLRAEETYQEIRRNIGLLPRDVRAVENRRVLLEESGLPAERVEALTEKYRSSKLLERAARIARTETIAAHAAARYGTWQAAKDAGDLPEEVKRVWDSAPASANPNRPCPICYNLDGEEAALGEPYKTIDGGEILHPPDPHPSCRCSEHLERGTPKPPRTTAKERPKFPPPLKPKPRAPIPRVVRAPARTKPPARPGLPPRRDAWTIPRTGRKVKLSPRQQKADQVTRWIGNKEDRLKAATPEERAEYFQINWVHGSRRKASVRMAEAARREFGLEGSVYNPRGWRFASSEINNVREDMRRIYETTQKELAEKGVEKVTLYRGVGKPFQRLGAMESWTTDPAVARKFGKVVLEKEVPRSQIFNFRGSSNWIDGKYGNQKEWVVIE